MAKILFIPSNSREIAQFNLVKPKLESSGHRVVAIALDEKRGSLLREGGFPPQLINNYKTTNMVKIIEQEKADIVVASTGSHTLKALIFAANHMGVPSLQVDDGITADYSALRSIPLRQSLFKLLRALGRLVTLRANTRPFLHLLATVTAISRPWQALRTVTKELLKSTYPLPSHAEGLNIAVISPFARKAYISMGGSPEKIFVTGQPRFDLLYQKQLDEDQLKSELGIPKDKGLITLATQPSPSLRIWGEGLYERVVTAVARAMAKFPEKQLILKLHPAETGVECRQILNQIGYSQAIICQDVDIHQLLNASDLLIAVHSTVALEAMLLDKPVITMNLSKQPDFFPYAESGAALGVYQEADLAPAMKRALYDPKIRNELEQNRKRFVEEHAYKLDGQASQRVADLINQLIEQGKTKIKRG